LVRPTSPGIQTLLTYLVTLAVLLGCVLVVPPVLRPLAWLLGRITGRLALGTGDVSVRHLVRERSRSAYTLGLIMIVLAGLFSFGAIDASMARAAEEVFEAQYGRPDMLVRTAGGVLPASAEKRVRSEPGVENTTAIRFASSRLHDGRTVNAIVVDPESYFDVGGFDWVAGDERSARRDLRRGGVVLSETTARSEGIRRGDRVSFATSRGPHEFVVVGTMRAVFGIDAAFGLDTARRFLNAGRPWGILVEVERGTDPANVANALKRDLGRSGAIVVTTDELRSELDSFGLRELLRAFFAILLIAAIIGLLGLANTLTMSIAERVREIGVMRATGASRGQVRRMVIAESATLGLAAFVLAVPLGWVQTTLVARGASAQGLPLRLAYPVRWVAILAVLGIVIAIVAAVGPAWRAGRLRPAEALRFE
jgi:putative ABC transport system permease protein